MSIFNKVNSNYLIAIAQLVSELQKENIPFEVAQLYDGFIVGFPSLGENRTGDIILHNHSYGHNTCAYEGFEKMTYQENDAWVFEDVEEVMKLARELYRGV